MGDTPLPPAAQPLEVVNADDYYGMNFPYDSTGLRVPSDLDEMILGYHGLAPDLRAKFDRATYWLEMAERQWSFSVSASFASLVSAVESLTERGDKHGITCPECNGTLDHEVPGATERFRAFFEQYAPGRRTANAAVRCIACGRTFCTEVRYCKSIKLLISGGTRPD
jgi:hypothetical protein